SRRSGPPPRANINEGRSGAFAEAAMRLLIAIRPQSASEWGPTLRARDERLEGGELVRVEPVDAGVQLLAPDRLALGLRPVRGAVEADLLAVRVGFGDDVVELLPLVRRHLAGALPLEDGTPGIADQRHEARGRAVAEVGEAAVVSRVTSGL